MKALSLKRRHPMALVALLLLGLLVAGSLYSLATGLNQAKAETTTYSAEDVKQGEKLFNSNCATCHGMGANGGSAGPSLVGVGAAAVDFQVGTGRMPLQMQGPQAPTKPRQFNDEQTRQLAAYVASLGPGPSIPSTEYTTPDGNAAKGGELFRVNCAMCHNAVGAGGALTQGKYAPSLKTVAPEHIYEAMVTGPQNMPVFNDANISPDEKKDIITFLKTVSADGSPGGNELGSLGPVSEGLFVWIAGLGVIIGFTIWLTSRSS